MALAESRLDDAEAFAEEALAESPERRDARIALAEALRHKAAIEESKGELTSALALRKRAAQTEPRRMARAADYARVATDARDLGDTATSLNAIEASLSADPSAIETRRLAAQWFDEDGQAERAVHHYLWLYEARPDDQMTGIRLATLYLTLRHFDDAEAIFARVLVAEPENVQASLGRADALEALGRIELAESIYRGLLDRHDDNPSLYFRYADFLDRQGKSTAAERWRKNGERVLPGVKRRRMRKLR